MNGIENRKTPETPAGPDFAAASEFESLLIEITSRLVAVSTDEVDAAIQQAQRLLCESLSLDRSALFQYSDGDAGPLLRTHVYQRPDLLQATGENAAIGREVDARQHFPWLYEQIQRGQSVVISEIAALPSSAVLDRQNLVRHGVQSLVAVPLSVGGVKLGVLTLLSTRQQRVWMENQVRRFQSLANVFATWLAGKRAITEQKKAQEALQQSEERFRQVAEVVGDFIWEVNADGLYTYTSPSVEGILGYRPDELVGKMHFYDLFTPETLEQLKGKMFQVFSEKKSFRSFPNSNISRDKQIVHLETSGAPFLDSAGNLRGYRGTNTNVTAHKLAQAALHRSWTEIQQLKDRLQAESDYLQTEIKITESFGDIRGDSQPIKRVLRQIEQVAPADCPVLIQGETGTGKELIARAIHRLSPRSNRVMVKVNSAALPSALVESELFGREKGAFTGASTSQAGRFEVADGSTIFLDEVGELSLEVQAKLLRVLQDNEFERLGSPKVRKVNVRVIAASNRDLAEEVRLGRFREDLFYRLSVFPIRVPSLRERAEDIPALVSAFVAEFSTRMRKKITKLPRRTMDMLQRYSWPGNIRELRNVLEHGVILSTGEVLRIAPLSNSLQTASPAKTLAESERELILKVFEKTRGRIKGRNGAAELLGINPGTLYSRMRKLGITSPRARDDISTRS